MQIISIKLRVYLLSDIIQQKASAAIAGLIDKTLCQREEWTTLHQQNTYKPYSFSGLAPVNKQGIYKKDTLCTFTIRTLDSKLAQYLVEMLPRMETPLLKGLATEIWIIPEKPIEKLYTLTPAIMKCEEGGYWKGNISFADYQKAMKTNLIKKFNYFNDTVLDEDFDLWTSFELTNHKPIAVPYKKITLLGDKLEMQVADNPSAQNLAYMALAAGVGELGSRGAGYVNYRPAKGV